MKKALIVAVAAVALQGCALFSSLFSGKAPTAGDLAAAKAEGDRIKAGVEAAGKDAERTCASIMQEEIGWEEERAVGGVVAVSKLKANKAFVDGESEKDPEKLAAAAKDGKPVLLPDSPKNDITSQVAIIGRNLARLSSRPDLPWTFGVVTSDTPNALSAPGGYVLVTSGLLSKITNEAQLAGVLAHEVAHVVLKHSIIKYRDGKHTQCVIANTGANLAQRGLPAGVGSEAAKFARKFDGRLDLDASEGEFIKFLMNAVIQLLQNGNDKESEFAADKMALELTAFAGYDATEYEKVLTSLGSGGGFLSTHPATEDRVAKLKALREGELAPFATGTAKPDLSKLLGPVNSK